jgi:hypothetical protein
LRRRFAIGTVLALMLLVTGIAVVLTRRSGSPFRTFEDNRFGWTIRYPSRMELGTFHAVGLVDEDGAWIANFRADSSGTQRNLSGLRRFPSTGVLLEFWYGSRFSCHRVPRPDTPLPPTWDLLQRIRPYIGGREPPPLFARLVENHLPFAASIWIGPDAVARDQQAIRAVYESIAFPREAQGC